MQKDKVSEKVIWENYNPSDDSISITAHAESFNQPQMVFCWKCGKSIPLNSIFCPWCQTELYTKCPKCGIKYSSQYPNCSQCGTNRENYILEERRKKKNEIHKFREKILRRWTYDIYRCYHRNGLGECVAWEWYEDGGGRRITQTYSEVRYLQYVFTAEFNGDKWGVSRFELDSNGNLIVREYTDFLFDEVHQFEIAQRKDLFGEYCANVVRNGESLVLGSNAKLFRKEGQGYFEIEHQKKELQLQKLDEVEQEDEMSIGGWILVILFISLGWGAAIFAIWDLFV